LAHGWGKEARKLPAPFSSSISNGRSNVTYKKNYFQLQFSLSSVPLPLCKPHVRDPLLSPWQKPSQAAQISPRVALSSVGAQIVILSFAKDL
jgi:hypothetical protein